MSYRASGSKGSKPKGQSAAAKHAYHLRADGYALGLDGPREDLAASGYGHMPAFAAGDPAGFWLASDSFERANGTLFRELQLNLPGELSLAQQQEVLQSYCARLFDGERLPHSWAIHSPDRDNHNPHAHLMVSETMTDDFSRPAAQHFKRYNSAKPEAGGAKKTRSLKPKAWLMEARAAWAEEVNCGLVAAGHKPRFDHRSKEVQLAEALRLGQLRRAARLDTPTQTHEGPRIAGMRRRVEAKKVALDDLPGYAQEVIKSNDQARELARAWLAQVERMTDAELAEHFADELNHGAHVKAWLLHEHAQALEEDRARSVATAQQAGELELLTAAQIEQAERAALAAELGELIALEQGDQLDDLLAIEVEQAHGAALAEDAQRERDQAHAAALIEDAQRAEDAALDGLLHGLHALCDALDELRERDPAAEPAVRAALDAADRLLALPPPSPILREHLDALERDYGRMRAQAEARQRAAEEQARRQAERIAQEQQRAIQEREQAEAQRRQIIEQAREEHRAGDRMVRHARTVLERAQGDYRRAQEALAGLPQLHQERAQAVQKANAHAAEARRLTGEADAWLAAHRVRALAGMTAPADELREQAERHKQGYRNWADRARSLQSQAEGRESGARIFAHSLEQARRELAEAESHADRRWRDQGNPGGSVRERFLEALQRVEERTQEPGQDQRQDWSGPRMR